MSDPVKNIVSDEVSRGTNSKEESDLSWTTGRTVGIAHVQIIARGGFGEVHKVGSLFLGLLVLTILTILR